MRDGDMYIRKNSDETLIQQGDMFSKRFMEHQDYDMESAGMGDLAGVYANAVRLLSAKTGKVIIMKLSDLNTYFIQINETKW